MEAGWSTNNNNVPIRLKDMILSCKYHLVKKIFKYFRLKFIILSDIHLR